MPAALFMVFQLDSKGAKEYRFDRSRKELSNGALVAKFGVDPEENESSKVRLS